MDAIVILIGHEHPETPPVSSLNADLLHRIFSFFYPAPMEQDATHFPVVLSHVCRQWRDIALQSPQLWTTIKMRMDRGTPRHFYAQTRLTYSQMCRVDIHIYAVRQLWDWELDLLIVPHLHRIRTLSISASSDMLVPVLFRGLALDMPVLETFELVARRGMRLVTGKAQVPPFTTGPSTFRPPPISRDFDLMWSEWTPSHLTSLAIHAHPANFIPTIAELHFVLIANQNTLETLELQGAAPLKGASAVSALTMRQLHALTVGYNDPRDYDYLFWTLLLPNVTSLTLRSLSRDPPSKDFEDWHSDSRFSFEPADHLVHTLGSCLGVGITHLALYGVRARSQELWYSFLSRLLDLESLVLYDTSHAVLHALIDCYLRSIHPIAWVPYAAAGTRLHSLCIAQPTASLLLLSYLFMRQEANLSRLDTLVVAQSTLQLPPNLPEDEMAIVQEGMRGDMPLVALTRGVAQGARSVYLLGAEPELGKYVPMRRHEIASNGSIYWEKLERINPEYKDALYYSVLV